MAKLSIIIPCYFNELNIPITSSELLANEIQFPENTEFEYIMVDDGSKDDTFNKLIEFKNANPNKVKIIKLSGNFGSYNAILAGMANATGDCNVIISADLQDPISIMPKMFEYWSNGVKLVVGNRQNRQDPFLTRIFASFFQFLIRKFAIKNLPKGGFDYVLFDKSLKEQVISIDDKNSNCLYLLMWMKYDFVSIPYTRIERKHGKSKWTFSKKIKLLIDTFVAFSFMPIRAISISGIFIGIFAFIYSLTIVYQKITNQISVEGWTATMLIILFVGSFQMISMGILGEYLYRTLDASRKRPNFIVDEIL